MTEGHTEEKGWAECTSDQRTLPLRSHMSFNTSINVLFQVVFKLPNAKPVGVPSSMDPHQWSLLSLSLPTDSKDVTQATPETELKWFSKAM